MIPIQDLAFLERENPVSFADWSWEHARWHRQIAQTAQLNGKSFNTVPLADVHNLSEWATQHYMEHVRISQAIGLPNPPDLSVLNSKDEKDWQNWMDEHARLHSIVASSLGIRA